MENRVLFLFLTRLLVGILLSAPGLTYVSAAEGKDGDEGLGIGVYVEGEKTEGIKFVEPTIIRENPAQDAQDSGSVENVQVEEGSKQVIQPVIARREVSIDKIDTEDFEIGVYGGLLSTEDFGANLVLGVRGAYHITELFFTEAALGTSETQETSYEKLSGGAQLITDEERRLTYFNVSLGINLLPGEAFVGNGYAFNTALYVIGGVGITRFAGDNRFTINYGGGYRFLATDWLAIHFDVRDHVFKIDLLGEEKISHNLETHSGITVFF